VNHTWQYYQTPKSTVASEQFHLLNFLLQFCLQFNSTICTSSPKWLTFQLWSHYLGHPSIQSHVSVTRWLIHQMLHDAQEEFIKEAVHLWGLPLVQFNLVKQFHLFLAQVLSLQTTILTRRMLPLLILLLILLQLIDPHFLLADGPNPVRVRILMNNWLKYLADLLTHLILIKLLVPILIQGKLKPASPTLSVALSLTSSIISCFNVAYISMLIWCNST